MAELSRTNDSNTSKYLLNRTLLLTRLYYVNDIASPDSNVRLTPVMVALARVFTSSHSEQSS